ncbi:large conductance mechanosensitive channel [Hydrogenispora ethanolica]|jgi:large conductance mechanosensitive channel|uniref:Large-conductance mechanosensitive channel n=1 Tax=Hydrogenispora ethanolica TaxID=1082276 RepID=A0A4R1S8L5_HYDET|nr:large conductance mechanosensitive channel protein MscL [Hydrogenispora ethanolica]TCL75250.1 large conductance mechanosensitive channel [Hydrogenispora ethanolica]
MIKEFKNFALKGNVLDLAIGVVIGTAFGKIVSSLVDDIIMPLVSVITGKIDFSNLFIALNGAAYPTLAEAKKAGVATINYGSFITGVVDFLLIAWSIFLFVRFLDRFKPKAAPGPAPRECPYCLSAIPARAVRCPHCTSNLEGAAK